MILQKLIPVVQQQKRQNLKLYSKLYDISSHFQANKSIINESTCFSYDETITSRIQHQQCEKKIQLLQKKLQKQQQFSFILKGYFHKVQKIMFNQHSQILQAENMNYQTLELHFRQMLRRLMDIHNQKLNTIPTIYRKSNIKVYKKIAQPSKPQNIYQKDSNSDK